MLNGKNFNLTNINYHIEQNFCHNQKINIKNIH